MSQVTSFMKDGIRKGYKKLLVWEKAHELVLLTYRISKHYPKEEMFGLTSQIRRAAVSVAANIAEGHSRGTKKEFHQFLIISKGSLAEVEYYFELSRDLHYISEEEYASVEDLRMLVGNLLYGLIRSIVEV